MNASLVRKQTNFNVCPVQSGVRGVETCRGNQISNLLTGWNRADRENSTLNRIRPAACPLVILCTKTDEARVRIVTPIIGCIGGEGRSTMARRKICSTRMRDESYRVRTFVRVHSVPGRDLCRCRLFVFFATIIPRIYWIRLPPFFLFFSRVPLVSLDVFSARSVLKIRTKINWFRSLFFNFQRANGCSWKIYDEHLRFGFIRALELTSTIVEDGFHRYAFLALPQVKPSYE